MIRAIALLCAFLLAFNPVLLAQGRKKDRGKKAPPKDWVTATMEQMTLDEKVGQLIVPALTPAYMNNASENFQEIARNIRDFHVGGYHAFAGDPAAVAVLLNRMQKSAKLPLLITADLEGGPGFQFRGATRLPRAMVLGAAGDEQLAYEAGKITALEGRAMGIGVNFYPVVDVNNNPRNPIINIRSFGEDGALVSRMAQAYIRGAQENGQIATAKHFPGHGNTSQDSHLELAIIDVSRERLNQVELPPFRAAVDAGVGAVMTAHIALPQIEPDKAMPATLSKMMNTDILRGELGFQGLLFTDAMTMRGVAAHFSPEEATLRALVAGADIILHPPSVEKSFNALKAAVENGQVPLARIEASVRRILQAKARLGLDKNRFVDLDRLSEVVGSPAHLQMARTMAERGVTLVRDERRVLPLKPDAAQTVLCVNILDSRSGWRDGLPGRVFCSEIARRHQNTLEVTIDDTTPKEALEILKKLARASDVIVAGGYIRVAAYKGSVDLNDGQLDLLRTLSGLQRPFVFALFGSPYLLTFVPELPSYILAYEYYPDAERAVVRAVWGEVPFTGKLPVSLPGAYSIGHGLTAQPAAASLP
jgi:beta-N-acetylhexosaminidase